MNINELIKQKEEYIIEMRRAFHKIPEASMYEFKTSEKIKEELDKMGISYRAVGTGFIADIKGKNPGKTIALRADIDGLSVVELNDCEYKSQHEGFMHACGHDAHIAMLLGAAKVLNEIKDSINGTVRLLFQPGEEVGQGAILLMKEGALEGVDTIFGMHIWAEIPTGKVAIEPGPTMAGVGTFKVNVKGKGGHGSQPENCIDALTASAAIVMDLQTIISREIKPSEPVVVTVGKLEAGTRFNVIAEDSYFEGTVRSFNTELSKTIPNMIERVVKSTGEAYRVDTEFYYSHDTIPVVNDEKYAKLGQGAVAKILGEDGNYKFGQISVGEDFSLYLEKVPGAFALVGCMNEEKDCCYSHHSGNFKIDEDSLKMGSALYVQYALDFLNEK